MTVVEIDPVYRMIQHLCVAGWTANPLHAYIALKDVEIDGERRTVIAECYANTGWKDYVLEIGRGDTNELHVEPVTVMFRQWNNAVLRQAAETFSARVDEALEAAHSAPRAVMRG